MLADIYEMLCDNLEGTIQTFIEQMVDKVKTRVFGGCLSIILCLLCYSNSVFTLMVTLIQFQVSGQLKTVYANIFFQVKLNSAFTRQLCRHAVANLQLTTTNGKSNELSQVCPAVSCAMARLPFEPLYNFILIFFLLNFITKYQILCSLAFLLTCEHFVN